jgi:lipopolysaccharide biosynthesis regulator YciM
MAKKVKTVEELKREANLIRQHRFLDKHRDEVNKKRRESYAERKENHKCPRCGKKVRGKNYIMCKNCLSKAKESYWQNNN